MKLAKAPMSIMYGTVQRTKAFMIGDSKLNWPKETKMIGATPIWAANEVDIPSLKNPGRNFSFASIRFWKRSIEAVATTLRIKPRSIIHKGFISSIRKIVTSKARQAKYILPNCWLIKTKLPIIPALTIGASNPANMQYINIPNRTNGIAIFLFRTITQIEIRKAAVKVTFIPDATTT